MPAIVEGEIGFDLPSGLNIHQFESSAHLSAADRTFLGEHPVFATDRGFVVVDFTVAPPVKHEHTPDTVTVGGIATDEDPVLTLPSGTIIIPVTG